MKSFLMEYPVIIVLAVAFVAAVFVFAIRRGYKREMAAEVYRAVCYAEKKIVGTKRGEEKKAYVIRRMHNALPVPLRLIINEEFIGEMIELAVSQMKKTLKTVAGDKLKEAGGADSGKL